MKNHLTTPIYKTFATISFESVFANLQSSRQGLSHHEAKLRLQATGQNVINAHETSLFQLILSQFKSPFIYLLIAAAGLAFLLGDAIDGALILLFVFINAALGFFQEFRSAQALKVLKQYTAPHALVLRNGRFESILSADLVPGDIVSLQPGDIVPADLRLIKSTNLLMDESVLTGESIPCAKDALSVVDKKTHDLTDFKNMVFAATHVASGEATGVVIATGINAYMGTIAKTTIETEHLSSFEKGMRQFSTFVLKIVGITLFMVVFANLLIKGGSANIGELLIFSIALATAVIPEALPLVTTFSLSRGALRLAKHKVVVKRLSAIEDLGGIEILCTDKTGTITQNKLAVVDTFGDAESVLLQAFLACDRESKVPDSFDLAITNAYKAQSHSVDATVVNDLPFDPDRKRNSVLVDLKHSHLLIVRGASESVLPYLERSAHSQLVDWLNAHGEKGHRVIVLAHKAVDKRLNYTQSDEETGLILTGALAFSDPLKKSSVAAVKKAQRLGVGIKIITGDSPHVAGAVAYEIGLTTSASQVITAKDFFTLKFSMQQQVARDCAVFARFSPQEKNQLIDILQLKHEVGFLGEGINDSPALKSANVGLVVQGASDIARETADVILLNSSLSVIIDGIEEGREVFANTIKYVKMTLASNFGNFYAVAIASLLINYLPMLPIQILLVNLLSDFPLIAVATDSVDPEEVQSPESYNLREFALIATLIGLVSTLFDFIIFALFYHDAPAVLQTNWFIASILTELTLMYSLRTRRPFYKASRPSTPIIVLSFTAALATLWLAFSTIGARLFSFVAPTGNALMLIFVVVALYFSTTELVKLAYYRLFKARA